MLNRALLSCNLRLQTDAVVYMQGICATVIKKVCRQLGIDKWPFKGNKITLRKQGLCHGRKKSDREQLSDSEAHSPRTPGLAQHSPAAPRRALSNPYHGSHQDHNYMEQTEIRLGQTSQNTSTMRRPSCGVKPARGAGSGFEDGMQGGQGVRRGAGGLEMRMAAAMGAGPGGSSFMQHNGMVERSMLDWRASAGGAAMFGWESRALLPGVTPSRQPRHLQMHQQVLPAPRSLSPTVAEHMPRSFAGEAVLGDRDRARKFSPGSDCDVKKEVSSGLDEDEDEGFDLSWLVPAADHSRSLQDMDAELSLLERFRGPLQYADN